MKKRYVYALLFGIPGLFVSGIISLVIFGVAAGTLWIFIFGDNSWPPSAETFISILFVLAFLILWLTSIIVGYGIGKRLEDDPALNSSHILISGGLTLLFIVCILVQQFSVGNLGPKSDTVLCSEYCTRQGYLASGTPPQNSGDRTCSCYDSSGNEVLKVPWIVFTRMLQNEQAGKFSYPSIQGFLSGLY